MDLAVIWRGKATNEISCVELYQNISFDDLEKKLQSSYKNNYSNYEIISDKLVCEIAKFIEDNKYPI